VVPCGRGGGYKKIVNVKSGRALDVKDESKEDGGVLIQYTSTADISALEIHRHR